MRRERELLRNLLTLWWVGYVAYIIGWFAFGAGGGR